MPAKDTSALESLLKKTETRFERQRETMIATFEEMNWLRKQLGLPEIEAIAKTE